RDYALWTHDPKLADNTTLSRYFDLGEGPVPEMGDDPSYYADVTSSLLALHDNTAENYFGDDADSRSSQIGPVFDVQVCAEQSGKTAGQRYCSKMKRVSLSQDFYKGDRAMRESGFDPSFRFGPYDGSTHHYAPVCLNSLLYRYERDLEHLALLLGKGTEAARWGKRAQARNTAIHRYLWKPQQGVFADYDFAKHKSSDYAYISSLYPLWAGVASREEAKNVVAKLNLFERPGGLSMSNFDSGMQWDEPFGWAPTNWMGVAGLNAAGFREDARRLAAKWDATVDEGFAHDGTIREKYNVVSGNANVQVKTGYKSNEIGFGWTNAVYLKMKQIIAEAPAAK